MSRKWSRQVWVGAVASLVVCCSSIASSSLASAQVQPAAPSAAYGAVAQPDSRQSQFRHPKRGYVAMGDSYASGEGAGVYFADTDSAANTCHRSPIAAAPLLAARQRHLRPLSFVACSGALTHDLYVADGTNVGQPAQLDALTRRTRVVSLTIGGNDIGFSQVLSACVQGPTTPPGAGFGCSANPALNGLVRARTAALAGLGTFNDPAGNAITPIATVLADIHQRAPRAEIYLAGYPELFGSRTQDYGVDASADSGYSCVLNPVLNARLDYADAQWLLANTRQLNAVFRQAAQQARQDGIDVTYVSPSTFDGHGLCDAKTAWIQPLRVDKFAQVQPESLHPTPVGWVKGYAKAFRRAGL